MPKHPFLCIPISFRSLAYMRLEEAIEEGHIVET